MLKEYFLQNHAEELLEILKDPEEFKTFPIYLEYGYDFILTGVYCLLQY